VYHQTIFQTTFLGYTIDMVINTEQIQKQLEKKAKQRQKKKKPKMKVSGKSVLTLQKIIKTKRHNH